MKHSTEQIAKYLAFELGYPYEEMLYLLRSLNNKL